MKYFYLFIGLCLFPLLGSAQFSAWTKSSLSFPESPSKELSKKIEDLPKVYEVYKLDPTSMGLNLVNVPSETQKMARPSIDLPNPQGKLVKYKLEESSVMESLIQAKYSDFKTYSLLDPITGDFCGRAGFIQGKFHAFVFGNSEPFLISHFENQNYTVAYTDKYDIGNWSCGTIHEKPENSEISEEIVTERAGNPVILRTYRLAFAATFEYSSLFIGGDPNNKAAVMAEMVKAVNLINGVYIRDAAIKFTLINENEKVIFTTVNDPFTDGSVGGQILGQSTSVINAALGDSRLYDIGHSITAGCSDVGGVANLGVPCTNNKGGGMTCKYSSSDFLYISVQCHEMGHQFTGQHTMSSCTPGSQVTGGSTVEPGSGFTIMSYAGLCGGNNSGGTALPFFHSHSISQIIDFSRRQAGSTCPSITNFPNSDPEVFLNYSDSISIPVKTPFRLQGRATDMENEVLTYSWEQIDGNAFETQLGQQSAVSALFRVYSPDTSGYLRYFPNLNLLRTRTTSRSELLPTIPRRINFRLIARDNNPGAGGFSWEEMSFNITNRSDSFHVVLPASQTGLTLTAGTLNLIRWNVQNTNKFPVRSFKMNIRLSTNSGISFPIVLASNIVNDGEEYVFIPSNLNSNSCRIMVEAADNIFFAVGTSNFSIRPSTAPTTTSSVSTNENRYCGINEMEISLQTRSLNGYNDSTRFEFINLPAGVVIPNSITLPSNDSRTLKLSIANVIRGDYSPKVLAISKNTSGKIDTITHNLGFSVFPFNFDDLKLLTPSKQAVGESVNPTFTWSRSLNADNYTFQLASNPSFDATSLIQANNSIKDTFVRLNKILPLGSVFYWRVIPRNECGLLSPSSDQVGVFSSLILTCNSNIKSVRTNIPTSPGSVASSTIAVSSTGTIRDVNLKNLNINANFLGNLVIELVHPNGTRATVMSNKCALSSSCLATFDDDATLPFTCNSVGSSNAQLKPETPFSIFNGLSAQGTWKVEARVTQSLSGSNGIISFNLEICSDQASNNNAPAEETVSALRVKPSFSAAIRNTNLKFKDANSADSQIKFTLVSTPNSGEIFKNSVLLTEGDEFTQDEINRNIVFYQNTDANATQDRVILSCTDNTGLWSGKLTTLPIIIDPSLQTSTSELIDESMVNLYPNPASQEVRLDFSTQLPIVSSISIFNSLGQQLITNTSNFEKNGITWSLNGFTSGIYYFKIQTEKGVLTKRVIVQK
jgi:hypothetical protein